MTLPVLTVCSNPNIQVCYLWLVKFETVLWCGGCCPGPALFLAEWEIFQLQNYECVLHVHKLLDSFCTSCCSILSIWPDDRASRKRNGDAKSVIAQYCLYTVVHVRLKVPSKMFLQSSGGVRLSLMWWGWVHATCKDRKRVGTEINQSRDYVSFKLYALETVNGMGLKCKIRNMAIYHVYTDRTVSPGHFNSCKEKSLA